MSIDTKKIPKLINAYSADQKANDYLRCAEEFLRENPEIIFWSERDNTRKGLFYIYADGVYKPVSSLEVDKRLIDFNPSGHGVVIPRKISEAKRMEILANVKKLRFFYSDAFNPSGVLNVKNGLFYVEDRSLNPHTMDILTTNQLPYDYDPDAKCDTFLYALDHAVGGDKDKIEIIQEFAGYCLTKDTDIEKGLFLVGAAASGKSTVLEGIEAMLGKHNISNLTMEQLCQPRFAGVFVDKLANIDNEVPHDTTRYDEAIKKIISGQGVTVDIKFLQTYTIKPCCKLIFAANDMPRISDSSEGLFRRIILIDFNNVIPPDKRDRKIKERVRTEGAGILNWALIGLNRLLKNERFTESKSVDDNVEELRMLNNAVYYFIMENYDINALESDVVPMQTLYEEYIRFCNHTGSYAKFKNRSFYKEIKKIFVGKIAEKVVNLSGGTVRVFTRIRRKLPNEKINWEE
jgi:putative DNA primase/helicase